MYAWFTMSREVEVTGLKMTASVPEDLQISLGKLALANDPTTEAIESSKISLVNSTGTLFAATVGAASNLGAAAPENSWDWSNSADISAYYAFGHLIPASSTTGENIFYTPDANGVGKTVSANASYYQANDALKARPTNSVDNATADTTGNTSARATLHAFTSKTNGAVNTSEDTWTTSASTGSDYTEAANWKTTNDDGYYIDIPIWIRSSSNAAVNISVDGYIVPDGKNIDTTGGTLQTDLELYRAVRVAILDGETLTADTTGGTGRVAAGLDGAASVANILPLKDAWVKTATDTTSTVFLAKDADATSSVKYTSILTANMPYSSTLTSILDSANLAGRTTNGITYDASKLFGVSASDTTKTSFATGEDYYAGTYAEYTAYDASNATNSANQIATIEGSTTAKQYGEAKKLIIRVWLDGEDAECWNDNAGQDWNIALKFQKIES